MSWGDYWIAYDAPFLIVNVCVFLVIIWQRQRYSRFDSAFYTIYLLEGATRYIGYIVTVLNWASPPDRNSPWWIPRWMLEQVCLTFLFLADTAIALNRFTAIQMPLRHDRLWRGAKLGLVIGSLFALAVLTVSIRPVLAFTIMRGNTTAESMDKADPTFGKAATILHTASFSFDMVLEIWTLLSFFYLSATQKMGHRENFNLLVYSVTTETLQFMVVSFLVLATVGWTDNVLFTAAAFFLRYLRWKHWFGTAIVLIVVNRPLRKACFRMLTGRSEPSVSLVTPTSLP